MAVRRIKAELRALSQSPSEMCSAQPDETDFFHWTGTILGPAGTPYENGKFLVDIRFPPDYPFKPPQAVFKTRVYHPNISPTGAICLDILKDK
jgi:ubiquitin-conjugating enzyme E2 D/E